MIPTRNRSALLAEALASIRSVEGPDLQIEIIVVNDGSTDDTDEVAGRCADRVIRSGGWGSSAARNAGAAEATGEFVAFLDDDDVWTPAQARPQIQLLRERPEFGAVVGQIQNVSEDLELAGDPWPANLPTHGDLFASFFRYYPQIGGTVIRRTALASVGESDVALWGDQDWDWHLRLALAQKVGFVPVSSVLFRQRPASAEGEGLEWRRLGYMYRVFWRNIRRGRAAGRLPSWPTLARSLLDHLGAYSGYFANSAVAHADQGERRRAVRALGRAFAASPLHAVAGIVRPRPMRSAILTLVRGSQAAHRGPDRPPASTATEPTSRP